MIRIISPAGHIAQEYIDGARKVLESWGHEVSVSAHAGGQYGRFSGTKAERIADLQDAINDSSVDTILCSRGGYGLAQIVDQVDFSPCTNGNKLLVGLSDVTVLHSALAHYKVPSVHAIMAKQLTELPDDAEAKILLRKVLDERKTSPYSIAAHPLNRIGKVQGVLRGGNLSILYGLRGTPYDLPWDNTILFIEDIGEQPYHIDRMMQNLRLSGALARIKGLVVGQFSDCPKDDSMLMSIEEIVADAVKEYDFPVCYDFPAGHVDHNYPLLLNSTTQLNVQEDKCTLG